jgi:hypothetical protein
VSRQQTTMERRRAAGLQLLGLLWAVQHLGSSSRMQGRLWQSRGLAEASQSCSQVMSGTGRTMCGTRMLRGAMPGVGTAAGYLHLVLRYPGTALKLGL